MNKGMENVDNVAARIIYYKASINRWFSVFYKHRAEN